MTPDEAAPASEPAPAAEPAPPPDPMKGIRGVFAATLVLESIVVLLALLVLPKFGDGATPLGIGVIVAVALLMIVAAGMQRRPWGLGFALALQVVVLACGLFVPGLVAVALVFIAAWAGLLFLRRDVSLRMARGELPAQQGHGPQVRDS